MKKEDFIVGKWYKSSLWSENKAFKFLNVLCENTPRIECSERIYKTTHEKKLMVFKNPLTSFTEVPISEIAKYLPKDHPDLQDIISRYVKLLAGFDTCSTGRIFDTYLKIPTIKDWNPSWTWESLLKGSRKKYFIPTTKEEYDAQFQMNPSIQELQEFPEIGFCTNPTQELKNYLNLNRRKDNSTGNASIFWNKSKWNKSFLTKAFQSDKTHYSIEQLNKFINNNSQQNEQKSNIISTASSENRRTIITGTVAIRWGRQQVTTGSRPQGNTTSANCGTTCIRTAQISKSVIIKENY